MNTTHTATAATARGTHKSHGRPTIGYYYGPGHSAPRTTGTLVTFTVKAGYGVEMTNQSGRVSFAGGVAGKFWFAPADLGQLHAEAIAEDTARNQAAADAARGTSEYVVSPDGDTRVNVVTMPSGEVRYFTRQYNGYGNGTAQARRFDCAWDFTHQATFPEGLPARDASPAPESPATADNAGPADGLPPVNIAPPAGGCQCGRIDCRECFPTLNADPERVRRLRSEVNGPAGAGDAQRGYRALQQGISDYYGQFGEFLK